MPWGKPHTYICVEPACRAAHNLKRIKQHYREQRGELYGKRPEHNQPLSDIARFNLFMTKTWRYAKCPECGQHMSVCRCCEPVVRHVEPVQVTTFDPLALPVPEVCADRETWKPWK